METIIWFAIAGLIVSVYGIYVQRMNASRKDYKAVCDINDRVNCSFVLSSEYSRLFSVQNTIIGVVFYGAVIVAAWQESLAIVQALAVAAVLIGLYLFYKLAYKIGKVCLVCYATYIINLVILLLAFF